MNTMQKGVITLLKSAVTQQCYPLPSDFDLEEAYPKLKRHHMAATVFEGAVLCGISQDLPIMQHLLQSSCKALLVSERQLRLTDRISAAFDENRIDYMLLKGCKMKRLYPKPELRLMGDVDILVRMDQYERIRPVMMSLGLTEGNMTDHELPWRSGNLLVELHSRLIPSYNKDFYAYFGDGWKLAVKGEGTRYSMIPEDEMVYLFTHFAKHYRDGGIGCRYVLDLWVFLRENPHLDEQKVKTELEKLQLREFYENIRALIAVWFEDAPTNEKMDFITDFIFDSGSWGSADSKVISIGVRDRAHKKGSLRAKAVYLLRHLFPGVRMLRGKYPVLQKAPWMLPLVWIYRPFYKLLSRKERASVKRHARGLQNLTPEKLENRQQALAYVGLDYHF